MKTKITNRVVQQIRQAHQIRQKLSPERLAKKYSLSVPYVYSLQNGRSRTTVTSGKKQN